MSRPGSPMDEPGRLLTGRSLRRERRTDVVTYRVRVDLTGTKPPLWRRLELASDMHLDELHDVLQIAFGWTDSHLHRFSAGPSTYDPDTEHYLSPFEVEEGERGTPESEVRIDEVLADVGDTLYYVYDFGDDWLHSLKLEAVLPRDDTAPRAACTAGRRPGPPEDCGGVPGYELFDAATDPTHPHHSAARAEIIHTYGSDLDVERLAPTPFAIDEINEALAGLPARSTGRLPGPLADLVHVMRDSGEQIRLRKLIDAAALDEPTVIDADTAARMVRPYTWLLDRVGDDGITLTGAGYLPPVHVEAAVAELGMAKDGIGKLNRENHAMPVLSLRESAQKLGLLRKHGGKLQLTARGRRLLADPVALWWHVAERTPLGSREGIESQAGVVLLIAVAAGAMEHVDAIITRTLTAIGWVRGDGEPLTEFDAANAAWDTRAVLRRLDALTGDSSDERSTPDGVTFARAALRTWP
ncbi:pRiA4b ORF-3-like protein [Pseudonocardia hierapolitana]|uniref:PRiA4b ORF-3-like protein n=1 Tax=Pseudonocardia hierapolitana TaxID=1128676 RepID=A0A561SL71_9PSEU|nr:plasmid pRiA4b ORF-3 family protein [Pseudonocardia hierapolitana]TWF75618.1 pRiA4b ORF-3-like protein [Pseudonocardia hierapolitana]